MIKSVERKDEWFFWHFFLSNIKIFFFFFIEFIIIEFMNNFREKKIDWVIYRLIDWLVFREKKNKEVLSGTVWEKNKKGKEINIRFWNLNFLNSHSFDEKQNKNQLNIMENFFLLMMMMILTLSFVLLFHCFSEWLVCVILFHSIFVDRKIAKKKIDLTRFSFENSMHVLLVFSVLFEKNFNF